MTETLGEQRYESIVPLYERTTYSELRNQLFSGSYPLFVVTAFIDMDH